MVWSLSCAGAEMEEGRGGVGRLLALVGLGVYRSGWWYGKRGEEGVRGGERTMSKSFSGVFPRQVT